MIYHNSITMRSRRSKSKRTIAITTALVCDFSSYVHVRLLYYVRADSNVQMSVAHAHNLKFAKMHAITVFIPVQKDGGHMQMIAHIYTFALACTQCTTHTQNTHGIGYTC